MWFRPELSAGVELSSAKADTATTERQSMDIVIRFMFIVGVREVCSASLKLTNERRRQLVGITVVA